MDDREEQLSWERRVGRPVAIVSFVSAILFLAFLIWSRQIFAGEDATENTAYGLLQFRDHKGEAIAAAGLQTISTAMLAVPLWFLYEVTKFRRPQLPTAARWLALIGPPLLAALLLATQFQLAGVADDVRDHMLSNPLSSDAADNYADDQLQSGLAVISFVRLAASLAVAFAFVLVSLNAMRAGVLSRFMGVLGIIVGGLFVIQILGPVPIVMVFWIAALGFLFLDKWPQGGRGPAWDAGEAIPWPTAADRQAELVASRVQEDDDEPEGLPRAGAASGDGDDPEHARLHPRSKKRKRKRR